MEFEEAFDVFTKLFENKLNFEEAKELLISLYERGESETEIAAAATVMRNHMIKLPISNELKNQVIDIVGTGGDKSKSINISSTSAIILASLDCYVAKHGNRAVTSNSGSADMLEALGINLDLKAEQQVKMLEDLHYTFMFAKNHHPAMIYITPVRNAIPHRTIFNMLGPISSPAEARKYLIGVFSPEFNYRIAHALKYLNSPSSLVVSSLDGMDEISVSAVTKAMRITEEGIEEFEINPEDFGIKLYKKEEIIGGNAAQNAQITRGILDNTLKGAKRDIVLLNAAYALQTYKKARDAKEGLEMATMALENGKASKKLKDIIHFSQTI
ncbi:MAG: anthranilate phosphoribosyltransferase [Campylobacteraceae bacterium]